MVTHSSILAWKIPWTEEPDMLHTVHRAAKSQAQLSVCVPHTHTHTLVQGPPSTWQVGVGQ